MSETPAKCACASRPDWAPITDDKVLQWAVVESGDWEELRHQPKAALAIGKLEWDYLSLIAEAEHLFDPKPYDPAPRHAQR